MNILTYQLPPWLLPELPLPAVFVPFADVVAVVVAPTALLQRLVNQL